MNAIKIIREAATEINDSFCDPGYSLRQVVAIQNACDRLEAREHSKTVPMAMLKELAYEADAWGDGYAGLPGIMRAVADKYGYEVTE